MPAAIDKWPLVLCGPVLRRVDTQSVSVFVALKHPRKVTATLYQGADRSSPAGSASADTRAFGQHLHVVVVTVAATAKLQLGTTYAYDVAFARNPGGVNDTGAANDDLASAGLLAGEWALGYADSALPSFALAPGASGLRFAHGSCRKPHAEGIDALPALDDLIKIALAEPLMRPHQALLTGDQIYADDVAQPLLVELTAAANLALGWEESIPLAAGAKPISQLKPGDRQAVAKEAKFTSTEADSHLLGLGEFYAMYLLAWSPALWPDALATFEQVHPDQAAIIAAGPSIDPETHAVDPGYARAVAARNGYRTQLAALQGFKRDVPAVRRALANVPTLMAFDDHEITDDWYIDGRWVVDALASPTARRVIANGLAAYSVFQAWGNTPDRFTGSENGAKLHDALTRWRGAQDADRTAIEAATLRRDLADTPDPAAVRWDYDLALPSHRVIVLDTRNHRGYTGTNTLQGDLLTGAELDRQLSARLHVGPAADVTVVVSPAPVFGHSWVEHHVSHGTIVPLFKGGSRGIDRETWLVPKRRAAIEELLQRLAVAERVVILTGDVHYGFSCAVRYWDDREAAERRSIFAHLLSSALHNEDFMTRGIAGHDGGMLRPQGSAHLGWPAPGKHVRDSLLGVSYDRHIGGTPAIADLPAGREEIDSAQWRYRVDVLVDDRPADARLVPVRDIVTPGTASATLLEATRTAQQHRKAYADQMRRVVGHNNLGEVFVEGDLPDLGLFQRYWFSFDGVRREPFTEHWLRFAPPSADDVPPGAATATDLPDLSKWADLLSFRPPQAIQKDIEGRGDGWRFHHLEAASTAPALLGDAHLPSINLDHYAVEVAQLPPGQTAEQLLESLRQGFYPGDTFIDPELAQFHAYDNFEDMKWRSPTPSGAVVGIHIYTIPGWNPTSDGASVVCTEAAPDHWTFSTVRTPNDLKHPVSGNRRWGFVSNADGTYTFSNRGADRATSWIDVEAAFIGFGQADKLWRGLQTRFAASVNAHGGSAKVGAAGAQRLRWEKVRRAYHRPTVEWVKPTP